MRFSLANPTLRQFLAFATLGVIGTAAHYATLVVCVEGLKLTPLIGSTLGFMVGAIINYLLNYYLTFRSTKQHRDTLGKFMLIAAVGMGINSLIMLLALNVLMLYYLLSQVLATVLVLIWNFTINKLWTFADHPNNHRT
ncbi:MAG: GtrA family protein [Gammaproteobacteria bacterium]|nr:GtrA family protein [Gammaproteobacteria bacterium]